MKRVNLYIWPFSRQPKIPSQSNPWTPDVKDEKKSTDPEREKIK